MSNNEKDLKRLPSESLHFLSIKNKDGEYVQHKVSKEVYDYVIQLEYKLKGFSEPGVTPTLTSEEETVVNDYLNSWLKVNKL